MGGVEYLSGSENDEEGAYLELEEDIPDPPNDFRTLSINPSINELFDFMPFLREIKLHGAFKDLDHYLDVNFRLLKEDFMNELRQGYYMIRNG